MRTILKKCCLLLSALVYTSLATAQSRADSLSLDSIRIFPKNKFLHNLYQKAVGSIMIRKPSPVDSGGNTGRSEIPFNRYEGKIIRRITITQLGFEQVVTDTASKIIVFGTRLMNKLHVDTRDWVIRNNLFIKEGDSVRSFMLADNERYLRTLNFIQDARINIKRVAGQPDSVDVEIITRDLFSITGGIGAKGTDRISGNITEANLLGAGQAISYAALYDGHRTPLLGHELVYSKNSILGTFVNGTVGYSQIIPGLQDGLQEDAGVYLQLDKPLFSPYALFAGGLYLGHKESQNRYNRPASDFYRYCNNTIDGWVGYNIGGKKLRESNIIRDRRFAGVRYFHTVFDEVPYQATKGFNSMYNNRQGILARFTFFRQNYYKANFIYGFGITEDLPYGYNMSVTAGWYRQKEQEQPYIGISADKYIVTDAGGFFRYYIKAGSFLYDRQLQDLGILMGVNNISRLVDVGNYRLRQYSGASYATIFNRLLVDPLRINNDFGIRNLTSGQPAGMQRISVYTETSLFLNYRFLGFRFAPFIGGDMALLSPDRKLVHSIGYPGVSGGLRTRNENLVFGTIELKGVFFPRKIEGEAAFKLILTSNLGYRYRSTYVSQPDFVQLNTDER